MRHTFLVVEAVGLHLHTAAADVVTELYVALREFDVLFHFRRIGRVELRIRPHADDLDTALLKHRAHLRALLRGEGWLHLVRMFDTQLHSGDPGLAKVRNQRGQIPVRAPRVSAETELDAVSFRRTGFRQD